MMKNLFAIVGLLVAVLYLVAAFGIGNFVLIYTPDNISCTKSIVENTPSKIEFKDSK